ncbi:hypothetical protein NEMIN01_0316 [Nematocida minor]|uniref:uncharacterized protein n=1 Tax=Nematocida minor TaxID=1912983 RepID=UPI00221FF069|nr:uncharacterized protein NEMIN01_0316 [Nematocida minor]KAI5189150.1 hypothetical protein NEMIN01_0316 [Nematocida minor]
MCDSWKNEIKVEFRSRAVDALIKDAIQEYAKQKRKHMNAFLFASHLANSLIYNTRVIFDESSNTSQKTKDTIFHMVNLYLWQEFHEMYTEADKLIEINCLSQSALEEILEIETDRLNQKVNSFINNWFSHIESLGYSMFEKEDYVEKIFSLFKNYLYTKDIRIDEKFEIFDDLMDDLSLERCSEDYSIESTDYETIFGSWPEHNSLYDEWLQWIFMFSKYFSQILYNASPLEVINREKFTKQKAKTLKLVYDNSDLNIERKQRLLLFIKTLVSPLNIFMDYDAAELSGGLGLNSLWEEHMKKKEEIKKNKEIQGEKEDEDEEDKSPFDIFSNLGEIKKGLQNDKLKRQKIVEKIDREIESSNKSIIYPLIEEKYVRAYNFVSRMLARLKEYNRTNYIKTAAEYLEERKQLHLDRIKMNDSFIDEINTNEFSNKITKFIKNTINEEVERYIDTAQIELKRTEDGKKEEAIRKDGKIKSSKQVQFIMALLLVLILLLAFSLMSATFFSFNHLYRKRISKSTD